MYDIYPNSNRMYIEGNTGWFLSRLDNLLYQIDINKRECTFLAALPESGKSNFHANFMGCKFKDKIVCMPGRSNYIRIYSLQERRFDSIRMPGNVVGWSVSSYIRIGKILYMISAPNKMIIVFDLEKLDIIKTINLDLNNDLLSISISGVTTYNDTSFFYIGYGKETNIFEFDANSETISKCCIIKVDNQYGTIVFDGKYFWLSGIKREFLRINKYTDEQKLIDFNNIPNNFKLYNFNISNDDVEEVSIENKAYTDRLFNYSFILKDKVWFLPLWSSHIVCVDLQSNEVIPIELENEMETIVSIKDRGSGLRQYKYIYEWIENDSNLVIYSTKNDCHYIIDGNTGKCIDTFKEYKIINYYTFLEYYNTIIDNSAFYENNNWLENELYKYKLQSYDCNLSEEKFVTNGYNIYKCV